MRWQDDFQIDGGKRPGVTITGATCLIFLVVTAAAYFHHNKNDVKALSDSARDRIIAMKKG
jgi:hypothetical protein